MPGYVIHIAIAQEYLKKHNKKITDDFIYGSICPDFTTNKSETHYDKSPAYINLKKFLEENEIDNDINQGRFLHLVTDYLFYNKYVDKIEKPQIYNDYDYTNSKLIEKYNVILPEVVTNKVFFKEGTPEILTLELAYKVIEEVSNLSLEKIKKEVLVNDPKWSTYRKEENSLSFLGIDSGFGKNNNSAYLEIEDNLILIDCGFTVFEQVKERFDLNKYNSIYVVVTHLHNDHAGSLSQLILYSWYIYHKKIIVVSACERIKDYLDITGTPEESYEIRRELENIQFIKTEHTDTLDAYGFKMDLKGKRIIYTGDTNTLTPFLPYIENATELYVDVSKNGGVHLKITDIIDVLQKIKDNGTMITLMHLDDRDFIKNVVKDEFNMF